MGTPADPTIPPDRREGMDNLVFILECLAGGDEDLSGWADDFLSVAAEALDYVIDPRTRDHIMASGLREARWLEDLDECIRLRDMIAAELLVRGVPPRESQT